MFTIKKTVLSMLLVVFVSITSLQAEDHNLTDVQLHAVMGIITSFILSPSSKELALQKIEAYAQSNANSPVPSIQDYLDADVTGVDAENLIELNEVIEHLTALEVDTTEEIQALVNDLSSGGTGSSITHNNTTYGTVTSPYTGKVWLDRNLGASQVCTAYNDTECYGDYYQWGRNFDGHQDSTSGTTGTQATDVNSAGTEFITSNNTNSYDWAKTADSAGTTRSANWSKTDGSSVCPVGYRVPTIVELRAETLDEDVTNRDTAFSNFLKLPSAGDRGNVDGSMFGVGSWGYVWSSSASGSGSSDVGFGSDYADWYGNDGRAGGQSVRCLRD
jgi:hypothetical protein